MKKCRACAGDFQIIHPTSHLIHPGAASARLDSPARRFTLAGDGINSLGSCAGKPAGISRRAWVAPDESSVRRSSEAAFGTKEHFTAEELLVMARGIGEVGIPGDGLPHAAVAGGKRSS